MSRREVQAGDIAVWCGWIVASAVAQVLLVWVGASQALAVQTAVVVGAVGWLLVEVIERWGKLRDEPAEQPGSPPEAGRQNRRRTANWEMAAAAAITVAAGPYRDVTVGRIVGWLVLLVVAGVLLAVADERGWLRRRTRR